MAQLNTRLVLRNDITSNYEAVKDDLVLCLVAEGQLYSLTAIGIENAGWTVVETMEKPN